MQLGETLVRDKQLLGVDKFNTITRLFYFCADQTKTNIEFQFLLFFLIYWLSLLHYLCEGHVRHFIACANFFFIFLDYNLKTKMEFAYSPTWCYRESMDTNIYVDYKCCHMYICLYCCSIESDIYDITIINKIFIYFQRLSMSAMSTSNFTAIRLPIYGTALIDVSPHF